MKNLLSILMITLTLTSCQKIVLERQPVTIDRFAAMLTADQHYSITADTEVPELAQDDIYTFHADEGEIVSTDPCRVTFIPYKIYQDGEQVKIDWVNLQLQYETFVVANYNPGQYFLLQGKGYFIKYSIVQP